MRNFYRFSFVLAMALCFLIGAGAAATFSAQRMPLLHSNADFSVMKQNGKNVSILFSEELSSGTDTACERVERTIFNLTKSGYNVKVLNEGWFPILDMAAFEAKLDRLSDKK